ncbi:MAG: hypothetical protein BWY15_01599 [Firmicutes bacterium ADurb.Bin193]|nr:MAG: hypothetical protein BWY15_01599 [Firmicutes bacterium ADurb.Bin193]
MVQELVRRRLIKFLNEKGVSQTFICKHIKLPNSILTVFKQGKKDLYTDHLNKLDEFLRKESY